MSQKLLSTAPSINTGSPKDKPTELNKKFHESINSLDDSQRGPVFSDAKFLVIKAPAGSGKTHTLLDAVAAYRYEHLNDKICAITYTRAARAEMEQRLAAFGVSDVAVSTIHVWCRNELEKFSKRYGFGIAVLQEKQIRTILHQLVLEYISTHPRIRSINEGILYTFIMGSKNIDIGDNYKRTFSAVESRYIQYKRANFLYDFTDYPRYLKDVLDQYNEVIDDIDALFVDEFQDIDDTQFELFERTLAKKKFYIGDPQQAIYIFRGASGEVFSKLPRKFEIYNLKYNYRSHQEIIDFAESVYPYLKVGSCITDKRAHFKRSSIFCVRDTGGAVVAIDCYGGGSVFTGEEESIPSREELRDCFKDFMDTQPMILCRTNKQVKSINEMGYFEVTTIHQAKGLEYDNVLVIDTPITSEEDANIAYVALTRARDNLFVVPFSSFRPLMQDYIFSKSNTSNLI